MNPSSYETGRYEGIRSVKVTLTLISQNAAANPATSLVGWEIRSWGTTDDLWYRIRKTKLYLNGSLVYDQGTSYVDLNYDKYIASGQITIAHNADGTKSIAVYLEAAIWAANVNKSVSGTSTLTTIPRYAAINTFDISSRSINSVVLTYTVDRSIDHVQHKVLKNGSWTDWVDDVTATGLQPNTYYEFKIQVRNTSSGLWTESWAIGTTTYNYATISSAPNFSDEENPTITYSNPYGSSVTSLDACISFTGSNDDISYRAISKTGTSYKFTLTESERNVLRQATTTSNTKNVIFYIRTVSGGVTYYSASTKTLSIVNANPTLSGFTFQPTDAGTQALTGWNTAISEDNGKTIKGKTIIQANCSTATPLKYATISRYELRINGNTTNSTTTTVTSGTNVFGGSTIEVRAVDSRTNASSWVSKTIIPIDYANPTVSNVSLLRDNYPDNDEYILSFDGKFAELMIDTDHYAVAYQYKKTTDSEFSEATPIDIDELLDENGAFSFSASIGDSFDTDSSYNIRLNLDDYYTSTVELLLGTSDIPLLSKRENGIGIGRVIDDSLPNGSIDIHGKYAIDGEDLFDLLPGGSLSVIDNLTSTSAVSSLSANQGRVLNEKIPTVINNLTSTSTTSALSANQGKVLNESILAVDMGDRGRDTLPIGSVTTWLTDTPPENWLICNGDAVSRTTYATLFSVIGTLYGSGNGTTTFNLPNMKGRVVVGKDSAEALYENVANTGGNNVHSHTLDSGWAKVNINNFNNIGFDLKTASDWVLDYYSASGAMTSGGGGTNSAVALGGSTDNAFSVQPYIVANYIIKVQKDYSVLTAINGDKIPIGAIINWGGTTAPTDWLICDGSAISRTTYADLFAVLGESYGEGNGTTTFNLPPSEIQPTIIKYQVRTDGGGAAEIIDNLTSTSTTDVLSANQGKVIKDSLDIAMLARPPVESSSDFDDYETTGIYTFGGGSGFTHNPSNIGTLVVANTGYYCTQTCIGDGRIEFRYRYEGAWTAWQRIPTTAQVDAKVPWAGSADSTGLDFNNFHSPGQWGFYNSCANTPTNNIRILEVKYYSYDWIQQICYDLVVGSMWERRFHSGTTWTAWTQRW